MNCAKQSGHFKTVRGITSPTVAAVTECDQFRGCGRFTSQHRFLSERFGLFPILGPILKNRALSAGVVMAYDSSNDVVGPGLGFLLNAPYVLSNDPKKKKIYP
jgi:hypothetical protein